MRIIDQTAEKQGMTPFTLMENAGAGLYRAIASQITKEERILIVAGQGNNGGDGIVLARYLKTNGYQVDLTFPIGDPKSPTSKQHLSYFLSCGWTVKLFDKQSTYDWIIDCLLGFGTKLPLRQEVAEVTKWINDQNCQVIAVDLPTGVSADCGKIDCVAVQANFTYTLHGYKPSCFLFPAAEQYGEVELIDIGLAHDSAWKVWTKEDVRHSWPERRGNVHKGNFGTGLLIAGSDEMPGSAALAAIGAVRSGIGKLTIGTTRQASVLIGSLAPEATFLFREEEDWLKKHAHLFTAIAIGPGINPSRQLTDWIDQALTRNVPIILDAGALSDRSYETKNSPVIVTPHPGEFSRMTGLSTKEIQANRMSLASEYAVTNHVIVVLKGQFTVIAFPDGSGLINVTGNPGLAKGGSGDTLVGMLLASIHTHRNVKEAVANAVFVHGSCADLWLQKYGEQALIASDFSHLLCDVKSFIFFKND